MNVWRVVADLIALLGLNLAFVAFFDWLFSGCRRWRVKLLSLVSGLLLGLSAVAEVLAGDWWWAAGRILGAAGWFWLWWLLGGGRGVIRGELAGDEPAVAVPSVVADGDGTATVRPCSPETGSGDLRGSSR